MIPRLLGKSAYVDLGLPAPVPIPLGVSLLSKWRQSPRFFAWAPDDYDNGNNSGKAVNFSSVEYNVGEYFDPVLGRWSPPEGSVYIVWAGVQEDLTFSVSPIAWVASIVSPVRTLTMTGGVSNSLTARKAMLATIHQAQANDYAYVRTFPQSQAESRTIKGGKAVTWFAGIVL